MSINDCGLLSTLIIGQTQMDTNETGIKTLRWRQSDGLMDGMKWPSSTRHVLFLAFHNVSHFPQCSYMFISTHLYEWLSNWGCHSMLCLSPLRVRCLVGNRPLSAVWYLNGSYTLPRRTRPVHQRSITSWGTSRADWAHESLEVRN